MKNFKKKNNCGKSRSFVEIKCDFCEVLFLKPRRFIKETSRNFCSKKCSDEASKSERVELVCANCNKSFNRLSSRLKRSRSGIYFCSRECKDIGQRIESNIKEIHPSHYNQGKRNYKVMAFRNFEHKCNRCGFKRNKKILQVHHIDYDRNNNELENLEILCPNCHAEEHWGK